MAAVDEHEVESEIGVLPREVGNSLGGIAGDERVPARELLVDDLLGNPGVPVLDEVERHHPGIGIRVQEGGRGEPGVEADLADELRARAPCCGRQIQQFLR